MNKMELTYVPTICPYCGVGCGLNLVVKDGRLFSYLSRLPPIMVFENLIEQRSGHLPEHRFPLPSWFFIDFHSEVGFADPGVGDDSVGDNPSVYPMSAGCCVPVAARFIPINPKQLVGDAPEAAHEGIDRRVVQQTQQWIRQIGVGDDITIMQIEPGDHQIHLTTLDGVEQKPNPLRGHPHPFFLLLRLVRSASSRTRSPPS